MTVEDVKEADKYSQPRIAAFLNEGRRQYFIFIERQVLCEIPTLQDALFYIDLWVLLHIQSCLPQRNREDSASLPGLHHPTP